ncbi:MAG TPA: hypothetical protein GXZ28_03210 [Clostridiales bacterium]|jgi:putative hydrolase of the HAD superfamily|nr:hypothetical protein [Clostridiales bacterium]
MKKGKRILAIIGIVLILSIPVITFISAFFTTEKAPGLFLASLFSAVVIPIMLYFFIMIYRHIHRKDQEENED